MAIIFDTEDVKLPLIKKRIISKWIKDVADSFGKKVGNISYLFCSDDKILEVNKQYLQHDYYTDIITFDYSEDDTIAGDIFISLDTIQSNAKEFNVFFEEELNRVIIHGVLHLCGINDKSDEEQAFMTVCENKAIEKLNFSIQNVEPKI